MDEIEELLPGLEEFLTITLGSESLSNFAEERRQFFIERLDIVKLPPTLPPREGRVLSPELLKETEETSGVPATHHTPDFAATQREISRSLVESSQSTEDVVDGAETSGETCVKVYDDIDRADSSKEQIIVSQPRPLSDIKPNRTSDDDNDENEGNALYEIPVARQQLSAESNSQSFGADCSSIATAGSTEDLPDDVLDSTLLSPSTVPPPLPPRRDIKFSDSGSRNSINFDDKPPELPFRPPLPKRNELNTRSDKSDRSEKSNNSDPELSGDAESTSYESFDEEEQHDPERMNKLNIQLPKKIKKRMGLTKSKKLSRSRSSSQWEISAPFRKLENIEISGELYYRGKLKWNRRIVAISNGCLAMYKPDKDARPSLVIPLTGYEASVSEREGRKGFELKIIHQNAECHSFSVDFKDWALLWMEHINGISKGQPPPKYHTHLARTFSGDAESGANTTTNGSKLNISDDHSVELEYDEIDFGGNFKDDLHIKEEGDRDSVKSSPVELLSNRKTRTLAARHFQSEKSPRHCKTRTLGHSHKSGPFGASTKDRTISATVKDILRRRQKAMYTIQNQEPCAQVERYIPKGDHSGNQVCEEQTVPAATPPAATVSISRWDWKSVFYNWSMPLDQLILVFRGTDLTGSNSNLSTGSECGSEDGSKPKLKGNKVMRMGSFAFRATQFFENIGKKTTNKRKSHQNSGLSFRHSGDFTDVRDGIVEEPSLSMSSSTGNLARRMKTTSDSSLSSVLNGAETVFSLPPASSVAVNVEKHWDEAEENDDFVDVTHKGYLHIFSSFNKRRWGKRWCLVRENMFECYRSDSSKQCELNFLLKPCVLRRAMAETNSDRGLMIMEAGREKITVEPLSKEEMGQWVQILLTETSTENIPEGLEQFLKEPKNVDGDGSSVMSFTVLKQWDMDCLVPTKSLSTHDYEDPAETADAATKLQSDIHTKSVTAFHRSTDLNISPSSSMPQSASTSENTADKINDSLSTYNKNKHTTDSGFYSAKGTNSDSDSSHEASDLDFGYAAQDSRSFNNSQHSSTFKKGRSSASHGSIKESCLNKDFSHIKTSSNYVHSDRLNEPSSSSPCVHLSHSSTSLSSPSSGSQALPKSTSESRLNTISYTLNSQHRGYFDHNNDDFPVPSTKMNLSKTYLNSASTVTKSTSSAGSSLTVLSPSGEEYSVVLKRSERSSRSPESGGELSNSLSSSSDTKSRTGVKLVDDELNTKEDNGDVYCPDKFCEEWAHLLANNDNESSYYEPVCALNPTDSNATDTSIYPPDAGVTKFSNKSPRLSISRSRSVDYSQPPPIPTSPIPDLFDPPDFLDKVTSSNAHRPMQETITSSLPTQPSFELASIKNPDSRPSKKKGKKSFNINTNNNADLFRVSLSTEESSILEADNFDADDVFLACESSMSPTYDAIAEAIGNPNTTPDELKDMNELLKCKQSEIKRKRLAVHDKRQRVLSDEERLACEKEIASLERAAENTELDIRVIQNHLTYIQRQAMETMKPTQGKHKLGSKKRKPKKKS